MARRLGAALIGMMLALSPTAVMAGPPGEWTEFTSHDVFNFAYHGYERTADGVLHVAWNDPGNSDDETRGLYHTSFNPDGTLGITNPIMTGGSGGGSPGEGDLVVNSNGTLRAFFAGVVAVAEDTDNLGTATAPVSGDRWTVTQGNVAEGGAAYAANIGAAVALDGTFFQAWGNYVHRGLSPNTDIEDYQTPFGCCAYDPRLVVDQQTGQIYRVWYSNGSGNSGLLIQEVNTSTGAPVGTAMDVPGVDQVGGEHDGDSSPMTGKPQVTDIPGAAGVYVAYHGGYPFSGQVILWKVGEAEATVLHDGGNTDYEVAMDAGPDGRLWVFWAERATTNDNKIYYRVSDTSRSSWSPIASLTRPPNKMESHVMYSMAADAQADRVDLFAHISAGDTTDSYESTWHTQVLAPLQGSDGDDDIQGTPADEVILGGAGNDTIDGGGGNDLIVGGDGDDVMSGGPGKDKIQGGDGKDRVVGDGGGSPHAVSAAQAASGADNLSGGGGNDTVLGQGGNDKMKGDAGNDLLKGGGGVNNFNGGAGKDTCVLDNKKDKTQSCEKKKLNFKLNFWPHKQPL